MKKNKTGLAFICLCSFMLSAGADSASSQQLKWRGYMVDRQCAGSVKEDSNPEDFLQHHTKDCALMPNCRDKGFCLYSKGKWLNFDKSGNEHAVKLLKASRRNSGFEVEVSGTLKGEVLKVETIKEMNESDRKQDGD